MRHLMKKFRMAMLIIAGCTILSAGQYLMAYGEEKEMEDLIKISAEDTKGIREFAFSAPKEEALPVILAVVKNLYIPEPEQEEFDSNIAFLYNILLNLRYFKTPEYQDEILNRLKDGFTDDHTVGRRMVIFTTMHKMDPKMEHPATRKVLKTAKAHEGDTEWDESLQKSAQVIYEYLETGDEEILEPYRISPEDFMTEEERRNARKERGVIRLPTFPEDLEKREDEVEPVTHLDEGVNFGRFGYGEEQVDLRIGMREGENATWVFYGDGKKLDKIDTNDVEFNYSEHGDFEAKEFEIWVDSYGVVESIQWRRGNLTGEIPPELGNLNNLKVLAFIRCGLTGEIPPELGNLDNLIQLELGENELAGEIPSELGNLDNLKLLHLNNNNLKGYIPGELGKLTTLESLILIYNDLKGQIPPELGNLTNLKRLLIHRGNELTGLPDELKEVEVVR